MSSIFALPSELLLSAISAQFPCRDQQIGSLTTLLSTRSAPSRNIVVHGLQATGKTAITKAILESLSKEPTSDQFGEDDDLRYAIIKSAECIGGRHLLEQTVGTVASALNWQDTVGRCENLAQLAVEIGRMVELWTGGRNSATKQRLVIVFDGIDHQQDAPPTLLPALVRLGEIIPNLTTIFIVTSPRPNFLHLPGVPYIEFSAYTKPELLQILSLTVPKPPLPSGAKDTTETWSRYTSAVWDSLSKHSSRDIISFRSLCLRLWPQFIRPILSNQLSPTPFSRLLVANRTLFQNETALAPSLVTPPAKPLPNTNSTSKYTGLGISLPYHSRVLLISAYLASFTPPRNDILHFSKTSLQKRRKKGGGTAKTRPGTSKSRKISRKLLGPQAFVLERMLAIYHAVKEDADKQPRGRGRVNGSADILMAVATLVSLRLVVRMGSALQDVLDGGTRYRVAVGWEVVRNVARSVGVEVEDYLED